MFAEVNSTRIEKEDSMLGEETRRTLPEPTGPMTQMRSPGCASKTMFLNENAVL